MKITTKIGIAFWVVLAATVLLIVCGTRAAKVVDTIKGTTNTEDTKMRENTPYDTLDGGGSATLAVKVNSGGAFRSILIPKNVATVLGAGLTIDSAVLSLNVEATPQATNVIAYQLLRKTYEGTGNWDGADLANGETCWKGRYYVSGSGGDSVWATAGAGATTAQSSNTGLDSATSTFDELSGWTDDANITSSDDARAYTSTASAVLVCTNLGLSIPLSASIDSIQVRVEGYRSGILGANVRMTKDGETLVGSTWGGLSNVVGTSEAVTTDTVTALWGTTWTPAEVNASTFGVGIYKTGVATIYVDQILVAVYYTIPADRGGTALSTVAVSSTGRVRFNIGQTVPAGWYAGTTAEYGVLLVGSSTDSLITFTSSEGTEANWPLWIFYSDDGVSTGTGRRRALLVGGD